jgi:hypothetical protein
MAGGAGLAGYGCQVQLLIADEADVIDAKTGFVERGLHLPHNRVPVHGDDALAFASLDHDCEAFDRDKQHQPLHPFRLDLERVLVLEIFDFCCVFALYRFDPMCLATTVGFGFLGRARSNFAELRLSGLAEVIMIGVDPFAFAVTVQPAAHRAQERVEFGPHAVFK